MTPTPPSSTSTQYFEIFGNRGIYHRGWSAVTKHRTPWQTTGDVGIAFDDDVWELYDGTTDWTQANDLADRQPAKLAELQRLFLIEADPLQRAAARRPLVRTSPAGDRRSPDVGR